jgi:hypothetical protein
MFSNREAFVKDKFNYTYQSCVDNFNKYLDHVYKTIGTLIIILGLIASSDKAREFLQNEKWLRIAILVTTIIASVIHVSCMFDYYRESVELIKLLKNIDYIGPEYYGRYHVKRHKVIRNAICILSLYGVLFITVLLLWPRPTTP